MNDDSIPHPLVDNLDMVLRKYGKIWIWSILITAAATYFWQASARVSMVTASFRGGVYGSDLVFWTGAIAGAVECVATFLSVFWLFQFMASELLPLFFPVEDRAAVSDGAQLLYRAFGALLIGLGARAASYIILLVWRLHG